MSSLESGNVLQVTPARLSGVVKLSGAKNSALRLLVASLLTSEPVRLLNFPGSLSDIGIQLSMLEGLGKKVVLESGSCVVSEPSAISAEVPPLDRSIRNTLLVLGALLARTGAGRVPLPGGCEIGARPFDLHEQLFDALGARVWYEDGFLCAEAPPDGLCGGSYVSPIRSTGVTENALLCGALIPEGVELVNPHLTPEVLDLIGMLRAGGVEVILDGTSSLRVVGVQTLPGLTWTVVPDRIEAATWATAAVVTRGDIEIVGFPKRAMSIAMEYLRAAGARIYTEVGSVIVRSDGPQPIELSVGSHPAVHSDMQPVFGAMACFAHGTSEIVDLRYPERFGYLGELKLLGARAEVRQGRARIHGTGRLRGGAVRALDLRAGAAMLIAGLGADEPVSIHDAWQLSRGYDHLLPKLRDLGANATWTG